jgi:hypothetical protein
MEEWKVEKVRSPYFEENVAGLIATKVAADVVLAEGI